MTQTPNSRTEANRETIRQAFDAWSAGTRAISDVFAPNMVWRIEGHLLASKECKDKQHFIDEAFYDSISFNDLWTRVQPRD